MTTMYNDDGARVELDYDQDNDTTQWETYDKEGNNTGGGQVGGDRVDDKINEFRNAGFYTSNGSD